MRKYRFERNYTSRPVKLIVSNIPKSARVWELWEFLSQFCVLADLVINESPISKKPWALVELEKAEPGYSEEPEKDDSEEDDSDAPELNESTGSELDQHSVDQLLDRLNGLWFQGKTLKVRRR
jgi:hypothetical protein